MNECNATLEPSGPVGAPLCMSLPIPVCTYRQYGLELRAIRTTSNIQFNGNPLQMEEHLAADQGCKVGATMMAHPAPPWTSSPVLVDGLYLIMLAFLALLVLPSSHANTKGSHNAQGTESVEVH